MIDKNDSNNQQGASIKQSLLKPPVVAREEIKLTGDATQQRDDREADANKPFLRFEKIQLWMNGFGIFVGVVVCVIYGFQLHVMKLQLAEMKGGSADTHELAVQAKNQADAVKAQYDATKAQSESTKAVAVSSLDQAKATNKLASESGRSADAAIVNSRAAQDAVLTGQKNLLLAERVLFVQERPWVGINTFNATVENNKPITGNITFNNYGHTPAFDVEIITACTFDRSPLLTLEASYIFVPVGSKSIMMPGSAKTTVGLSCDLHLSAMQFAPVEQGLKQVYLFGIIRYKDSINSSNPSHVTRFCGHWKHKTKTFEDCPSYNSAD